LLLTTALFIVAVFTVRFTVTPPRLQSAFSVSTTEEVVWTRFYRYSVVQFNLRPCIFNNTIYVTLIGNNEKV